jgi:hypothetical protein
MADSQGRFNAGFIDEVDITIDIDALANALLADRRFITAVAKEVRNALTKDARGLGNLYGKWAQKPPVTPASKRRAT